MKTPISIRGFLLGLALALASAAPSPAQCRAMADQESVEVRRSFAGLSPSGYRFSQAGEGLRVASMFPVLENYPESRSLALSSRAWHETRMSLGVLSLALMGIPALVVAGGGHFNSVMFAAGLSAGGLSLGLGGLEKRELAQAVYAYNRSLENRQPSSETLRGGAGPRVKVGLSF